MELEDEGGMDLTAAVETFMASLFRAQRSQSTGPVVIDGGLAYWPDGTVSSVEFYEAMLAHPEVTKAAE